MPTRRIIEAAFITSVATICGWQLLRLWGQKRLATQGSEGVLGNVAEAVVFS